MSSFFGDDDMDEARQDPIVSTSFFESTVATSNSSPDRGGQWLRDREELPDEDHEENLPIDSGENHDKLADEVQHTQHLNYVDEASATQDQVRDGEVTEALGILPLPAPHKQRGEIIQQAESDPVSVLTTEQVVPNDERDRGNLADEATTETVPLSFRRQGFQLIPKPILGPPPNRASLPPPGRIGERPFSGLHQPQRQQPPQQQQTQELQPLENSSHQRVLSHQQQPRVASINSVQRQLHSSCSKVTPPNLAPAAMDTAVRQNPNQSVGERVHHSAAITPPFAPTIPPAAASHLRTPPALASGTSSKSWSKSSSSGPGSLDRGGIELDAALDAVSATLRTSRDQAHELRDRLAEAIYKLTVAKYRLLRVDPIPGVGPTLLQNSKKIAELRKRLHFNHGDREIDPHNTEAADTPIAHSTADVDGASSVIQAFQAGGQSEDQARDLLLDFVDGARVLEAEACVAESVRMDEEEQPLDEEQERRGRGCIVESLAGGE